MVTSAIVWRIQIVKTIRPIVNNSTIFKPHGNLSSCTTLTVYCITLVRSVCEKNCRKCMHGLWFCVCTQLVSLVHIYTRTSINLCKERQVSFIIEQITFPMSYRISSFHERIFIRIHIVNLLRRRICFGDYNKWMANVEYFLWGIRIRLNPESKVSIYILNPNTGIRVDVYFFV